MRGLYYLGLPTCADRLHGRLWLHRFPCASCRGCYARGGHRPPPCSASVLALLLSPICCEIVEIANSSTNPDDWEDTERKCAALEAELRARNLWEDTELFVDDENETGGPQVGPKKGWGESIAGAIMGGASSLVSKLTGRSNSQEVLPTSRGQYDGGYPPSPSVETPDESKPQHFKALAEHSWAQATIAARGIGEAAAAVGGAVGQSAKNAYDGIKDGVSERDDLPELPAKDAPKPPAKDAPKPPAKDEVDALDEPAVSQPVTVAPVTASPVVSGRVKNVKLNEVTPITPSEPAHPVENIIPEPTKIEEKLKAADKTNKVQENPEGEPEHPVDIIVPEPTKKEEPKAESKEEPKKEAEKPVEDAVKDLKINDNDDVAESAKIEMEEAREEAAAIVAASDAEVKVEQEEAKEEEAAEAKEDTEAKEDDKPKTGGNDGGKKKNKKNKKKN